MSRRGSAPASPTAPGWLAGAPRPASPVRGYFYEPTVLTDVTPAMAIAQEEICGPVATLIRYKDQAEAVTFANQGFGLAATVWTGDPQRGLDIAKQTRVGTFGINLTSRTSARPGAAAGASGSGSAYGPEGMDAGPGPRSRCSCRGCDRESSASAPGSARLSPTPSIVSASNSCQ